VRVFILPPSVQVLSERLNNRGNASPDFLARRLGAAADELRHWREYHYAIINSDVATSVAGLQAIVAAERLKRSRLTGLTEFVAQLASDPLLRREPPISS
jgi:guanylate kinase